MDFNDSPEEATFRAECRAWLELNAKRKARADQTFGQGQSPEQLVAASREWQGRKAAAGYGAITWPEALGGRGGTPMQEVIYREEEGHFEVPLNMFAVSIGMVIPAMKCGPGMWARRCTVKSCGASCCPNRVPVLIWACCAPAPNAARTVAMAGS